MPIKGRIRAPPGREARRFWVPLLLLLPLACGAAPAALAPERVKGGGAACGSGVPGGLQSWAVCGGRNGPGGRDAEGAACATNHDCIRSDK